MQEISKYVPEDPTAPILRAEEEEEQEIKSNGKWSWGPKEMSVDV
jgi:hypothetical protein